MTRLSASVDPEIVNEAQRLAGAKTRRETIDRALREFAEHRRVQELAALAGAALVDTGLEELKTWRSEFEAAE